MDGDVTRPAEVRSPSGRPRVPLVLVVLLVGGVWLAALIPAGPVAQPDFPPPPHETPSPLKTSLEALAELRADHRTDRQIRRGNGLIDAAAEGDDGAVRRALAAGADVNARYVDVCRHGQTALMIASFLGHEGVVRMLLAAGADVDLEREGETALHHAVRAGHGPVVARLVAAGSQHDPERLRLMNELIRAACKGFVPRAGEGFPPYPGAADGADAAPPIHAVLAAGAAVDGADPRGFTPLMYAANLGLRVNVEALVAAGADVRRAARDGSTALSLAEQPDASVNREGRAEVAAYLRAVLTER